MYVRTMSDSILLSIIVPVYNVGPYLGRCMDSIMMTEGISDLEIILVDDGSTDDSASLADSYAVKYDNVRAYHKPNGGLSDARNYGLSRAGGKYIFFCDADDEVDPEELSRAVSFMSGCDADVILWDGVILGDQDPYLAKMLGHEGLDKDLKGVTGTKAMTAQIKDHRKFAVTAWLCISRRDHLILNELYFEKGLIHEDELWTPKVMTLAGSVVYLPFKVLRYRIRDNSIMNSGSKEEHAAALTCIRNELYGFYEANISDKADLDLILSSWAEDYLWEIQHYETGRYGCSKQIPARDILRHSRRLKAKIKSLILLVLGPPVFCKLFKK